jgi:UrcA family protein
VAREAALQLQRERRRKKSRGNLRGAASSSCFLSRIFTESQMNTHTHHKAFALLTLAAICGITQANESDRIGIEASRIISRPAGRTSAGLPLEEVWLNERVSTAGLDLRTSAGLGEMEKRINTAAVYACHEIGQRYPLAEQSDAACARAAARPAIAKVREAALLAREQMSPTPKPLQENPS